MIRVMTYYVCPMHIHQYVLYIQTYKQIYLVFKLFNNRLNTKYISYSILRLQFVFSENLHLKIETTPI